MKLVSKAAAFNNSLQHYSWVNLYEGFCAALIKNKHFCLLMCVCVCCIVKFDPTKILCELPATLKIVKMSPAFVFYPAENYDQQNVPIFLYYVDVFYTLCQIFWSAPMHNYDLNTHCSCYPHSAMFFNFD